MEDAEMQVSIWRVNQKDPGWVAEQLRASGVPAERIDELISQAYGREFHAAKWLGRLVRLGGVGLFLWSVGIHVHYYLTGWLVANPVFVMMVVFGLFLARMAHWAVPNAVAGEALSTYILV
jgi:hypothetical protein